MKRDDSGDASIQVDLYGVRASLSPRPDETPEPDSWRAVARRLNRELMSITTNTFVLVSQTLKSAISLARGIGELPSAVNQRIARAHEAADRSSARPTTAAENLAAARARLQAVVSQLESRGLCVAIGERDERLTVAVLSAGTPAEVEQIVAEALDELEAVSSERSGPQPPHSDDET